MHQEGYRAVRFNPYLWPTGQQVSFVWKYRTLWSEGWTNRQLVKKQLIMDKLSVPEDSFGCSVHVYYTFVYVLLPLVILKDRVISLTCHCQL